MAGEATAVTLIWIVWDLGGGAQLHTGTSLIEREAGVIVATVTLFGAAGCIILTAVASNG